MSIALLYASKIKPNRTAIRDTRENENDRNYPSNNARNISARIYIDIICLYRCIRFLARASKFHLHETPKFKRLDSV